MPTPRRWWPRLEEVLRRQELMDRMMLAGGVDPYRAVSVDGGLAFMEARIKCCYCLHEAACRHWLDATETLRRPPDFCPNARFFLSCWTADN